MISWRGVLGETARSDFFAKARPYVNSPAVPLLCIALVLIMQATLVFNRAINWDEFHFYEQVELFTRGVLQHPLQTLHVRIFQWLPSLAGTGVDHIIMARVVMFFCEMVTSAGIILLATRFTNWKIGVLCALAYVSSGFVMQHGFSFRTDPIIAALMMSALCILGYTRFKGVWVVLFAALIALAAMFSIKIILWAPAFAGLAWWRWHEESYGVSLVLRVAVAICMTAIFFGLLYYYHSTFGVSVDSHAETILQNSASKMFFLGVPPYWALMLKFVSMSEILVLTILFFPFAAYASPLNRNVKVAMIGLFLPITLLGFYFNALPYFYAFMLPPIAVACALPLSMICSRYGVALPAFAFMAMAFGIWMQEDRGVIDKQREVQNIAYKIFPENISYFDFSGFLPRQDKANTFMTLWGAEQYRQGGSLPMREVMQRKPVPLVVEMDDMFSGALLTDEPQPIFLQQDVAALRESYVPFWGPYWVAGKNILPDTHSMNTEFLVPGPYTLSGAPIEFDGRRLEPGDVVTVKRGVHALTALGGMPAQLLWGDHLRKPDKEPPARPYWTFF